MRVLVVDDDAVFRDELTELLRDEGHSADSAPSVAKAIEWLEGSEADVVLSDLKMPRQGGLELLREVRARWPRTLVVMITGFATIETAIEAMKAGAFDYIRKPFRIEQVRTTLELAGQERALHAPRGSRRDPWREARELAADGQHDVLFLGEPGGPAGPHLEIAPLDPAAPSAIIDHAESFLSRHPNGAIVVAGVERLLADHRLEEVVAVLDRLRRLLEGHGPLRVAFDPGRITQSQAAALGATVAAEETRSALEALANPIRRKVLERLGDGPGAFGEVMAAAGLDDSPKLSFHLRKLTEAGLIVHEGQQYRLSGRGEAAVRLMESAAFLPPAGGAGNLAFPGGTSPGNPGRTRRSPPPK